VFTKLRKIFKNNLFITIFGGIIVAIVVYYVLGIGKEMSDAKQFVCPVVAIKYDGQGFFLENLDSEPFILVDSSEQWRGDTSNADMYSVPNIPDILKPGDTSRINLGIMGYNKKIVYRVKPRLRNLKLNKLYEIDYEITADVVENGTRLVNHKVVYKECVEV